MEDLIEEIMQEGSLAYHVSNKREEEEPRLTRLRPHPANDSYFDGVLFGLPVVFFSTTLMKVKKDWDLPGTSLYPTAGEVDTKYQRYTVNLSRFNECTAFIKRGVKGQIHILLLPPDIPLIGQAVDQLVEVGLLKEFDLKTPNPYLMKCQTKKGEIYWKVNKYGAKQYFNFVNLAYPKSIGVKYQGLVPKQGRNNAHPVEDAPYHLWCRYAEYLVKDDQLTKENAELVKKNEHLIMVNAQLIQKNEHLIAKLKKKKEELTASNAQLKKKKEELTASNAKLKKKKEELTASNAKLTDLLDAQRDLSELDLESVGSSKS